MEVLNQVLKQHFEPNRLVIARRSYFYQQDQAAEESVADYMAELRRLAAPCDFRDFLNDALRDRLVCRLHNEGAQKWLLFEADLLLTKGLTITQSIKVAEVESHSLNTEKIPVHQIEGGGKHSKLRTPKSSSSSPRKACYHCGKNNHLSDDCYYKEAVCAL